MTERPLAVVFDPLSWITDFDYSVETEVLAASGVDLLVPRDPDERESKLGEADVVISGGIERLGADDFARMRSCVGLVAAQVGLDHIDLDAAHSAGLNVVNVVASTEEVADHAMALLLSALRQVVELNAVVEDGHWDPLGVIQRAKLRRLRGLVLGIIGPGNVGRAVAERARAFGFEIVASSRRARPGAHKGTHAPEEAAQIEMVGIEELLQRSDAIVVCADANPSSIGLLGESEFEAMKDGVVVVNISRGSLIDESALLAALQSGKVARAALDVREPEPPDPSSDPLREHPGVIMTPHVAGASIEARADLHRLTALRVLELLAAAGKVAETPFMDADPVDLGAIHHVDDLEEIARARLAPTTYGYVAGGAGQERSVSRNREALDSILLMPRVMRDVETVSTSTSILGAGSSYPLIVAPSAVQRLSHPDGEIATARAVRDAGLTMILSMNASTTMEDVAAEGVSFFMQLYFSADRPHMESVLRRAESAGARALCLTVDHAGMPTRLRELRRPLVIPPEVEFVHLDPDPVRRGIDRSLTWGVIEWIRGVSSLPIVLKGLLHPEDGRIASELGVDAVVVSNHGGRQLDAAVSSYDVLGRFLDVVGDEMEVYADGGIRSGNDLVKVLALGAKAGLIGRPVWWGLASGGEAGVRRVIELITTEFEEVMRLCGAASVNEIDGDILFNEPPS